MTLLLSGRRNWRLFCGFRYSLYFRHYLCFRLRHCLSLSHSLCLRHYLCFRLCLRHSLRLSLRHSLRCRLYFRRCRGGLAGGGGDEGPTARAPQGVRLEGHPVLRPVRVARPPARHTVLSRCMPALQQQRAARAPPPAQCMRVQPVPRRLTLTQSTVL